MVHDPVAALETLVSLGFQRLLTSGCENSALEGLPLIKQLIDQVCINDMYLFPFKHLKMGLFKIGLFVCAALSFRLTSLYLFLYAILLSHFPPFLSTQQAKGRIAIMPGQYLSHFPCKLRFCFLLLLLFFLNRRRNH